MDTMSTGATIAFAIDCYEHGIINSADTGGLELTWGNSEAMVTLCGQMARREGFGALLADGVKKAAARIGRGAENYAVHVHGQEPGYHDPRFVPSHATSQQLDATPGRHTQGGSDMNCHKDLGIVDKYDFANKGELHKKAVTTVHMSQAAGICHMGFFMYPLQAVPDFLNAIVGWHRSLEDYMVSGERIANIRHAFNLREGLNPLRFAMPGIVTGNPPLTKGGIAGVTIDMVAQNTGYLKTMVWDPETAMPSRPRLEELDMADVADALGL
jgi:aldehyde:ferredoxin oxidoreductase